MLRSKKIKLFVSSLFVLLAVWVATPKVYLHALLGQQPPAYNISTDTRLKSQDQPDDGEFDKYNKPAYFSIFKFISNFIPIKPHNAGKITGQFLRLLIEAHPAESE
jgi:hypothetical protein